ncbi:hypothetical protein H634G_11332 [Metarhizium anisopliae BRIP 53293]|uniref:Myb-like domain-containing protein n=1 Tax=Metarhizium anisopliae BRIP 53293 TaxID=1291518 RepID=A0A0D9NLE0_METAN|nr:hypothetical protein H634G_11332 [Metarhizium anisopliae BRIP 53293]
MPLQERAIAYFLYHYDLESPSQNKIGDMGFVILSKSDKEWEHYRLAFEACAMASFINGAGAQLEYESLTFEAYDKALIAMRSALQDPDVVYEDATLAAVLLLALFECLYPTTGDQKGWRNHVQGAIKLAKERGRKQTDTQIGHMLFRATRTLMVIYSLATLEDEKDKELWWSEDDECTSTQQLCVGVASLNAEATALGPSGQREKVEDTLKRCQDHDRACESRWEELSKSTRDISSNNTDPWLLMLRNMLTCARILLNSTIIRCATWIYKVPNYRTSEEYGGAYCALGKIMLHSAKVNEQQLCWAEEAQSSFAELDVQLQPGQDSSGCAINKWIEDSRNLWKEKPLVGLQPLALTWSLKCLTDDQKIAIDTRLRRIVEIRGALPLHEDRASMPSFCSMVEQIPRSPSHTTEACTQPSSSLSEPATDTPEAGSRDSSPPSTGRFRYTQEDDDTLLELSNEGIPWREIRDRFPKRPDSSLKTRLWILRNCQFTADEDRLLIRLKEEKYWFFADIAAKMRRHPALVSNRYNQLRRNRARNN